MTVGFPAPGTGGTVFVNGNALPASSLNDLGGTLNLLANYYTGNPAILGAIETANIVASAATGTINIDCKTSTLWYYTTNASANWTLNFRGNSTTTLNSILSTGQSLSAVFINTNGSTAYYPSAFTIDGTSVTPKWAGGSAPTSGNINSLDAYSFTIMKTASATFTVIAGGAVRFA
jgi:hypothetical protein